jgi:hypothetical protein
MKVIRLAAAFVLMTASTARVKPVHWADASTRVTSSSLVWLNSSSHRPTALNGSGVSRQTTQSAIRGSRAHVSSNLHGNVLGAGDAQISVGRVGSLNRERLTSGRGSWF